MKMTFDAYDARLKELEAMPDPKLSGEYGITKEDIDRIEADKEKFVPFLMYLSTRPWYKEPGKAGKTFANSDALDCVEASNAIENLLYDAVELYEAV